MQPFERVCVSLVVRVFLYYAANVCERFRIQGLGPGVWGLGLHPDNKSLFSGVEK